MRFKAVVKCFFAWNAAPDAGKKKKKKTTSTKKLGQHW